MANSTLKKKIEAAKEKPTKREFLVRFDPSDFTDLEKEATRQNLSMNKLVQIACRDMLDALAKRRTG